jgi:hypothetical protein
MRRRAASLSIPLCLAIAVGPSCGRTPTQPSASPSPPAQANIKVLIDPNPVIAEPTGDRDYPS